VAALGEHVRQAGRQRAITEDVLAELFQHGKRLLARKHAVEILAQEYGYAQPTAYRALSADGKFAERLVEKDGLLAWRPGES